MAHGIGHNNGPSMEPGQTWRTHAWTRARANLLPRLPLEVLRLRVKRAEDLGLPYRTYASVRASTGRDVIGFLFSTNALRVLRKGDALPEDRAVRLSSLRDVKRVVLSHVGTVAGAGVDGCHPAPVPFAKWAEMRRDLLRVMTYHGLPADGLLVIGATSEERLWSEAARTAGFLTGERYFAPVA